MNNTHDSNKKTLRENAIAFFLKEGFNEKTLFGLHEHLMDEGFTYEQIGAGFGPFDGDDWLDNNSALNCVCNLVDTGEYGEAKHLIDILAQTEYNGYSFIIRLCEDPMDGEIRLDEAFTAENPGALVDYLYPATKDEYPGEE